MEQTLTKYQRNRPTLKPSLDPLGSSIGDSSTLRGKPIKAGPLHRK